MLYTSSAHDPQASYSEHVELSPDEARELCPASEVRSFLLEAGRRRQMQKWAIITLWQNDEITAQEAIWWLDQCGFITIAADPEYASLMLGAYVVHEKRLAEGARS